MTVLLCGSFWHGSLEESYARAFETIGWRVVRFDWERRAGEFALSKISFVEKVARLFIADRVAKELIASLKQEQPDLVLIVKGRTLSADALLEILRVVKDRPVVNFNPDSPWDASNRSQRLLETIPLYHAHFTWNKQLVARFLDAGAKEAHYLPFAYDPELHFPVESSACTADYDAVFVGTYSPERDRVLGTVDRVKIAIAGNGWERARHIPREWVRSKALYGEQAIRFLHRGTTAINILRPQNAGSHNMRTFEIPASAAPMIASRSEEHETWFRESDEAEYFEDARELSEKIRRLANDPAHRAALSKNGYERVREETYAKRAQTMINTVGLAT